MTLRPTDNAPPEGKEMSAATPLSDFLHKKAAEYNQMAQENQRVIQEWCSAVERLHNEILEWLAQSDPEGIIQPERTQVKISEPGLGQYQVQRLNLHAFGKWIGILPKARLNMKNAPPPQKSVPANAVGRMDITDEVRRYVLYRIQNGEEYKWVIDDLTSSEPLPLDRPRFEEALLSYLR
jgi:hypothetical protein